MYNAGQVVKVLGNPGANFRATASSANDANIIEGIPNGTIVPVIGPSSNGFANVGYQGSNGYVSEQFLAIAPNADLVQPKTIIPGGYRITGSNVNIRSGPSLNDGILVMTGPVGETFVATGPVQNGYAAGNYTDANGETFRGWIAEQYMGFGQDPAAIVGRPPVPAPTRPAIPVQTATNKTPPPAGAPSGVVMAGGLLALALVIYFMAK